MFLKKGTLALLIVFGLVLTSCGGSGNQSPAAQEDTAAVEAESTIEPVYVYMDCGTDYVQTGSDIALIYYWIAQTEQQVEDFAKSVQHAISVDGKPVTIKALGTEAIETTEDGYYTQMFLVNIGQLDPGTYDIITVANATEPVFDGWDWYGPDEDTTGLEGHCLLTVGDEAEAPIAEEPEPVVPTEVVCSIDNDIRSDWQNYLCETFDDSTTLWIGDEGGTSTRVESGQYLVDNSTKVAQGYTTGFIFPVSVGAAQDYMISVDGSTESLYKSTAWGVYVRSTEYEIVYFFMINNQGRYMLTGSSDQEANRYLGNIKDGSSKAIVWDDVNNITAVVEGTQMDFYVNGELVTSHEAIDAVSPDFGLIVWGGEGVSALNRFDNLLVRVK